MVMYANEFKNKGKPKINWNKKLTATYTLKLKYIAKEKLNKGFSRPGKSILGV